MDTGTIRSFNLSSKEERNRFLQRNRLCVVGIDGQCRVVNTDGHPIGLSKRQPDGSFLIHIEEQFLGMLCDEELKVA